MSAKDNERAENSPAVCVAAQLAELLLPWGNDRRSPKGSLLGESPEKEHSFKSLAKS